MNSKGMRRLVEAGKSLLILLLALSAVYLLGRPIRLSRSPPKNPTSPDTQPWPAPEASAKNWVRPSR